MLKGDATSVLDAWHNRLVGSPFNTTQKNFKKVEKRS
jgi:hypothetical protein